MVIVSTKQTWQQQEVDQDMKKTRIQVKGHNHRNWLQRILVLTRKFGS